MRSPKMLHLKGNTVAAYVHNTPNGKKPAARSLVAKLHTQHVRIETGDGKIYLIVGRSNFMPNESELQILKETFPDAQIEIVKKF